MSLTESSPTIGSPIRRRYVSDDASVVSKTSSSSSSDSVLPSSPTSLYGNSSFVFDDEEDGKSLPKIRPAIFKRCYGTADLSDRIGRTLSVLLVARLALSFLLASIDDEEWNKPMRARNKKSASNAGLFGQCINPLQSIVAKQDESNACFDEDLSKVLQR